MPKHEFPHFPALRELARRSKGEPLIADVESPYNGPDEDTLRRNILYARLCCGAVLRAGLVPYASHLFFTQPGLLDDRVPHEREWGIRAGKSLVRKAADVTLVFLDLGVSAGMEYGCRDAEDAGRDVVEGFLFDSLDPGISYAGLLERATQEGLLPEGYHREGWLA